MQIQIEPLNQIAISIRQTCALLGLSRYTVSHLLKSGRLYSKRVGRRVLIPTASIHEFVRVQN